MLSKNEEFAIETTKYEASSNKIGSIEYQMPKKMADELLKARKGAERNMRPQDFLIKYVNEECGLLRACTKVTTV